MSALRLESGQLAYRGDSALPSAFIDSNPARSTYPAQNESLALTTPDSSAEEIMRQGFGIGR
jgi:hypothetical protein